jgi:hypothetical protein
MFRFFFSLFSFSPRGKKKKSNSNIERTVAVGDPLSVFCRFFAGAVTFPDDDRLLPAVGFSDSIFAATPLAPLVGTAGGVASDRVGPMLCRDADFLFDSDWDTSWSSRCFSMEPWLYFMILDSGTHSSHLSNEKEWSSAKRPSRVGIFCGGFFFSRRRAPRWACDSVAKAEVIEKTYFDFHPL